jgi:nicotinate dehydrogenase subunit A
MGEQAQTVGEASRGTISVTQVTGGQNNVRTDRPELAHANQKLAVNVEAATAPQIVHRRSNMSMIQLKVNGRLHNLVVEPTTPLLFVLSDELGLRGPKFGCGMAQCGACTVILRGHVVRSCVMPVSAVGQDEITTLEGLGTSDKPHPIQQAFIDEGAAQCGFCLSGVILTAKAVLDEKPQASDQEIGEALGGVLCRCFTHVRMLRAIRKYADTRKA